jgi:hypothetical protein
MDDNSNSEAGIINFPKGKTIRGQEAQGLYKITFKEEFAKMTELTGTITQSSGVQARVSFKTMVRLTCHFFMSNPARQ